jgi:hypothetical protein
MSTNRDQSNIAFDWNSFSFFILKIDLNTLFFVINTIDNSVVQQEFHALLLQRLLETETNFFVKEHADSFSVLNDGNFSS